MVAAQLLELVERESARRFGVHCGTENGLLVCPCLSINLMNMHIYIPLPRLHLANKLDMGFQPLPIHLHHIRNTQGTTAPRHESPLPGGSQHRRHAVPG